MVERSTIASNAPGWVIDDFNGPVTMAGSIVYGTNGNQCDRAVIDAGFNSENDAGATCGLSSARHDIVGKNPQLGALRNNGGPTETMLPPATSPALDQIPAPSSVKIGTQTVTICPLLDQRGTLAGASPYGCAIGAVQAANTRLPVVTKISPASGKVGGGTVVTISGVNLSGRPT